MKGKKRSGQGLNEEFSIEFGDVNGIKLYELFAMDRKEQEQGNKEQKDKKKK
jgi:hypothetical protein